MKFFLLLAALLLTGAAATPVPSTAGLVAVVMALVQSTTVSSVALGWAPPTTNTDGSTITAPLTYNLYMGVAGSALVEQQTGIVGVNYNFVTSLPTGVPVCFAFTAVESGVESSQSNIGCITVEYVPNAPTNFQVT